MQPWETYEADLSIDLSKHHVPKTFVDKVAFRTVKLLRIPTDIFFKVMYTGFYTRCLCCVVLCSNVLLNFEKIPSSTEGTGIANQIGPDFAI